MHDDVGQAGDGQLPGSRNTPGACHERKAVKRKHRFLDAVVNPACNDRPAVPEMVSTMLRRSASASGDSRINARAGAGPRGQQTPGCDSGQPWTTPCHAAYAPETRHRPPHGTGCRGAPRRLQHAHLAGPLARSCRHHGTGLADEARDKRPVLTGLKRIGRLLTKAACQRRGSNPHPRRGTLPYDLTIQQRRREDATSIWPLSKRQAACPTPKSTSPAGSAPQ